MFLVLRGIGSRYPKNNAFLEAIYFKKPLLINRYAIFVKDIEPQGVDLIVMDGYLRSKTIETVRNVLESEQRRGKMVTTNYELAKQYYSFGVLKKRLNYLMDYFFGVNG